MFSSFSTLFNLTWSLPFSLLPSISLPANIQRCFLSFVLKRFLGRFIKGGGLDVERIQAQIGEGKVDIQGLELDTEEVNALIPPSLPFLVTSGTLSNVSARLPFPNLWSAPLSITLDDLTIHIRLVSPKSRSSASDKGKKPSRPGLGLRALSNPLDLASSVTTAADEFLHEELDAYEEAELDRSIRQSLILSHTDPFNNSDDVPGAFPGMQSEDTPSTPGSPLPANVESTTVLAGLVERVLARLEFQVSNVKIRITHDDPKFGAVFEVRIGEIRYADETESASSEEKKPTSVRVVRVSRVNLYMLPLSSGSTGPPAKAAPPPFVNTTSRSSSMSSATSRGSSRNESSSDEGNDDMMMSMAVADLRQSVADTEASGASMYQSALTEAPIEEVSSSSDAESDRPATPTPRTSPLLRNTAALLESGRIDEDLILSLGPEDVVLRMTTSQGDQVATASSPPGKTVRPTPVNVDRSPTIAVELIISAITSALLPTQIASILSAFQIATMTGPTTPAGPPDPEKPTGPTPRLTAVLSVKHLLSIVIYDLRAAQDPGLRDQLTQFWAKPSTTDLPIGHLRLRLEGLTATYRSGDERSRAASGQRHRSEPSRRNSVSSRSTSPLMAFSILDASIFEYLASATSPEDDSPPGGSFPVSIFDTNLPKQYTQKDAGNAAIPGGSSTVFPEFDGIDWRNSGLQRRGPASEKAWKVRQKGKGVLKGTNDAAGQADGPVIELHRGVVPGSSLIVNVLPLHLFLDLSLLERLLPMLRLIAPAVKHVEISSVPPPAPFGRPTMPPRKSESYVLDDLDAQATLPPTRSKSELAMIHCPMIRVSIRCPAPVSRRGTWGDGAHLRSGIVTLDVHRLSAKIPQSGQLKATPHRPGASQIGPSLEWGSMILFFSRIPSKRSSSFLVIGPLAPEAGEIDPVIICPSVSITSSTHPRTEIKTTTVVCRIPSVQAKVIQSTIEGLQFFADDLTHWLDGAFGDGSRPKPRDELKMIGSRFFGSKGSSSASSSVIEDDDEESLSATVIRLLITETDVSLHVPRSSSANGSSDDRVLSLKAADTSAEVQSNLDARKETAIKLVVMDADFCDISETSRRILGRTTPLALIAQNHPIVQLRFSSLTDPVSETKETSIKAILSSFTFYANADLSWIRDLKAFARTPEGVFEDVVPSEMTRISVEVYEGSVHLTPPTLPGAFVAVLGSFDFKTDLVSDAVDNAVKITMEKTSLLMVDDVASTMPLKASSGGSLDVWKTAGYAQLVDVIQFDVDIWRDVAGKHGISIDVSTCRVVVSACADSLASLGPIASDLAAIVPRKTEITVPARQPHALDQSINIFASVDEDAFNRVPDMISGADLIEDDLPTNLDYLDNAARRSSVTTDKATGESLRTWHTPDDGGVGSILSEVTGETIRILHAGSFDMQDDYWDTLTPASPTESESASSGKIRVRVHDCALNVLLYEGYDWLHTRKEIEDEIKAVRKRLEKIRQLLASGQQADESIENTQSVLFNSVYIGLDQSREMDTDALLAAIEELGEDTSSISSWQTDFPAGQPNPRAKPHSKKTRLRGKRLTRSKRPQIEFSLQSVKCEIDQFASDSSTSMRVHATVGSMEILDHIKTSTWKKFLTEMKADRRGNVRETDADMVRIELTGVRPSLPSLEEEYRLRVKILPLRLHVDQDALDFLKRFSSFSASDKRKTKTAPAPAKQTTKEPAKEPFFQHVEIFPIELKLDYKPKRVDFNALREGRTIELMNFFHFDGAEMTLRHITLSGISGMTRLSNTLQDIWTPDVKANQLADVISGVSPIRSMVNVGSGVADLILLPIEQYRKDGRVARGVQRGTNSFVKSTALEMMKLGARLATGTQVILEKAEGVLGGKLGDKEMIGEVSSIALGFEGEGSSEDEQEVVSRYAKQPSGAREGVQAAYQSLSKNVNAAAQTILAVPMEVYERSGDNGPLRAVVRAVPIAVLKPMIGASEAVSKTLLGVRNSLDPAARDELNDKYK